MEIRPEIIKFAEEMERVMRTHDKNKGDTWKRMDDCFLERKLLEDHTKYSHTNR